MQRNIIFAVVSVASLVAVISIAQFFPSNFNQPASVASAGGSSQTFTSAGTFTFTVPDYETLSVVVRGGAGGGGGGYSGNGVGGSGRNGGNGGNSIFRSATPITAEGGGGGGGADQGINGSTGGSGGASGGDTHTIGAGGVGGSGGPGTYPGGQGGSGGQAEKVWTIGSPGAPVPGSVISFTVGDHGGGGAGGHLASSGKSGDNGSVIISWTGSSSNPDTPSSASDYFFDGISINSSATGCIASTGNILCNHAPRHVTVVGSGFFNTSPPNSTLLDLQKGDKVLFNATVSAFNGIIQQRCTLQAPNAPADHTTIWTECAHNDLYVTKPNGQSAVLNALSTYTYAGKNYSNNTSQCYSPLNYSGTGTDTCFTSSLSAMSLPMRSTAFPQKMQCVSTENSKNGDSYVYLLINRGVPYKTTSGSELAGVRIPAGQTGLFELPLNINFNPGDQLAFNLDTHLSTTGSVSFYCSVEM